MSLSDDGFTERFRGLALPSQLGMVADSCQRRADLYDKKRQRAEQAGKPIQVRQNALKRDKWKAYADSIQAGLEWVEAHV